METHSASPQHWRPAVEDLLLPGPTARPGAVPMMTPRQEAFRADYRARISPWYSGPAHVVVIAALGLATIWYCASKIHQPSWAEWLVIPVVFLACNLFEWALNRYVMHRPVKGLM